MLTANLYRLWENAGVFDSSSGEAFTIGGADQKTSRRSHYFITNKVKKKEADTTTFVLKGLGNWPRRSMAFCNRCWLSMGLLPRK